MADDVAAAHRVSLQKEAKDDIAGEKKSFSNDDVFAGSRKCFRARGAYRQFTRKVRAARKFHEEIQERSQTSSDSSLLGGTINLDIIKGWRQECQSHHGGCCNERHSEALAVHIDNLILIDVELQCLVERPSSTTYVALSYVWGRTPMVKTQHSNFERLKQPGALVEEIEGVHLPRTIRDAMYLVKALGELFLWVDCLSLFQDETTERMDKSLQAMACIYASADFTIVAAGASDADSGLPGIGGPSEERTPSSIIRRCAGGRRHFRREGYPWASRWVRRGWTYQESLFARRLLVLDTLASWVCGRCVWLEEHDNVLPFDKPAEWPTERPHLGVPVGLMSLIPRHPSLGRWGMLVERYSTRVLTYEKDLTRAFAGATDVMQSTFPGGLVHGLPIFFFDIALLWRPRGSSSRRPGYPSWSWIGWRGGVECLSPWCLFYPGVYRRSDEDSEWVPLATLESVAKYQIFPEREKRDGTVPVADLNAFYRYQNLRNDPHALLPVGWNRIPHPKGDFYTHASVSGSDFRYSYPLPTVNLVSHTKAIDYSPVLTCTAPVAKLEYGDIVKHSQMDPATTVLKLQGVDVGMLTVDEPRIDDSSRTEVQFDCNLVALSEAIVSDLLKAHEYTGHILAGHPGRSDNWRYGSDTPEEVRFYNVMWIEWENGTAYRKGVGAVQKEAWESLRSEIMSFKLG